MTLDVDRPTSGWATMSRLRLAALASVIANIGIVVTGGAVRLTASGLGCPTWPTCTDDSLTPTGELGVHSAVEFTNRTLTFVLSFFAIATVVLAYRNRREVPLAWLAFGGIPAQALLGGITVLTGLNPWTVAAHFLLSMGVIAVTFLLWWRVSDRQAELVEANLQWCVRAVAAIAFVVLAFGTVVTGSGPHAGDKKSARMGFDVENVSQLHADAVMLLIGVTIGLVLLVRLAGGSAVLARAARDLLVVELAQGLIGYVQYFTGVPVLLVGAHMLGAALVWVAALRVLLTTTVSRA